MRPWLEAAKKSPWRSGRTLASCFFPDIDPRCYGSWDPQKTALHIPQRYCLYLFVEMRQVIFLVNKRHKMFDFHVFQVPTRMKNMFGNENYHAISYMILIYRVNLDIFLINVANHIVPQVFQHEPLSGRMLHFNTKDLANLRLVGSWLRCRLDVCFFHGDFNEFRVLDTFVWGFACVCYPSFWNTRLLWSMLDHYGTVCGNTVVGVLFNDHLCFSSWRFVMTWFFKYRL